MSVAGLMLTNPNTLGLFEEGIEEIAGMSTAWAAWSTTTAPTSTRSSAGAAPAIWVSTSCTSTPTRRSPRPTAGEGRARGPSGSWRSWFRSCRRRSSNGTTSRARSRWDDGRPRSIGRLHGYHGNAAVLVRAYAYVFLHGADGLKAVSELAALNANYLAALIADDFPLAFPDGRPCTSSSRPRRR